MLLANENKFMDKKYFEERIVKEGLELFKKQKQEEHRKKIKEQQEIKEMLERYWPWERTIDSKPRGLRNLRLEELFPHKDYQNAKRFVGGTLDLGRPGCGAPNVKDGQKLTRIKEDPLLRFQFGNKDLRKAVDNALRYKTNKDQQMEYKKELDRFLEEKKRNQFQEKIENGNQQGWSNEETLKKLEREAQLQRFNDKKNYDNFKQSKLAPPNRVQIKLEPITHPKTFMVPGKNRKLSPFSRDKENGLELVDILAKDRRIPIKPLLCSTDVTKQRRSVFGNSRVWNDQSSNYLKELTEQMLNKRQQIKEMKVLEEETARRHFSTWESFWGKPGHGAPRSNTKKASIERLLYPEIRIPVGVA
ncbi:hypothetical protein ABEB36_001795 [Hypothenemus hampei]|uniref:Uncharacterized protein n=1 Tax=Hypothenemus hampei TaxID=57062 RepID=A0ABD1FHP9_HYPHA